MYGRAPMPSTTDVLRRRLQHLDLARVFCVFDFDGTLAPIVGVPERAAMRAATRRKLIALAQRRAVVVLSGRARVDLLPRLAGVPLRHVIGSHGAEWASRRPPQGRSQLRRWSQTLARELAGLDGVILEDKGWSLAVHYRHAPSAAKAERAIHAAIARAAPDADLTGGKRVVNLGLPGWDKASALRRLRELYPRHPLVFVGDDENDERAFAAHVDGVLGIRVGPRRGSAADFALPDQESVDVLLDVLRGW
jgi:trehalose 6-phosphate phosphatase